MGVLIKWRCSTGRGRWRGHSRSCGKVPAHPDEALSKPVHCCPQAPILMLNLALGSLMATSLLGLRVESSMVPPLSFVHCGSSRHKNFWMPTLLSPKNPAICFVICLRIGRLTKKSSCNRRIMNELSRASQTVTAAVKLHFYTTLYLSKVFYFWVNTGSECLAYNQTANSCRPRKTVNYILIGVSNGA